MTGIQATQVAPAAGSPRPSVSILAVLVAAVGPLWPFALANGAGYHDNQRILEILCLVLSGLFGAAVLILYRRERIRRLWNTRMMFLLALFFGFGLVSSIVAYSPRHALFEWANFLSLAVMSLLIASEIRTKGDALLDKILLLCGLGCALYIFLEIITYIAVINTGGQPKLEVLVLGFDNYRFLNHVQTATLPLLGLLAIRSNDAKRRIFSWAVISIWWALLFVTAGRGTFIGMLAGVIVTAIFLRKEAVRWCKVMLYSALLGLGVYLLLYVLIPVTLGLQPFGLLFSLVDRSMENPGSGRWSLWVRAWEIIAAHPWLGAGPLHFAHFGRTVQNGAHPHNWILQIACEWGIPAFLCLAAALALAFKKLLATRRYPALADGRNQLILAAWLTGGVAILVDGLVSGLFVMPSSQLWIALYIGCAWGWICSVGPAQAEATMRLSVAMRAGGAIGVLVLIWLLGNGLWPEIRNLSLYEEQSLQKELYPGPVLRPRIWLGGYF
ncbi:O-antigen ligase family protein [Collimonas fungivorans]|uniref:Pilin glycosylation enzyme n=1 Tax=Collimonas fungivorans (strain Ter331) TaxID=1005048 RepID=G0AFW9_COLFT|nr:O-antigen ligase family protein [Collimonas fungivorans]AEK63619.1 Pilin glycosylation enzyme [Collimonas fungivorans Ter331]